jgi:hypothetical protein
MFARHAPFSYARRHVLLASTAVVVNALHASSPSAAEPEGVLLQPSGGNLFRVRIEMRVEGNVNVPNNPLVSRKSDVRLPLKSDAVFDYEERYRRPTGADRNSVVTVAERYYHEARNQSQLNRNEQVCELRKSVRETIVRRQVLPEVIYAVDDYFHRDELDLLRIPAASVSVDQLLPSGPVKEGSQYMPTHDALVSVLNLTSVEASDVRAEVVAITDATARIQFRGKIDGSVEGVPTVIRTVGKLTFDRIAGTCTWFALGIHETREIGAAEPGFDVAGTIKMVRKPLTRVIALSPRPPQLDITGPIPSDRMYVSLDSTELGFSVLMDRRWRMMSDVPGTAMMRMITNDRSIAQCDFRPLVALEPGNHWTLEAFQDDVRRTLGGQLSDLIEADQRVSHAGLRVLRVVAQGAVEGVPIQWIMLHFSNDSGRRLSATFTMEGRNSEVFAGSDTQLAATLRFTQLPERNRGNTASEHRSRAGTPQVAKANFGEDSDDEVQSASDLR